MARVRIFDSRKDRVVEVEEVFKTDDEWRRELTPEQYEITTRQGTERPFTCTFDEHKEPGIYRCVRCGTDLFAATSKFDSGTGWPSYYEPVSDLNIRLRIDTSHGMSRTEVRCPPGACLRRRPAPDGQALLHQLGGADFYPLLATTLDKNQEAVV
jgi:peptide-methionine (R)-S-oxide reductase